MLSQERAPIYEALQKFGKRRVVPFDVPGHKRGRGNPELTQTSGGTMRLHGCQLHEAPGQPLPPRLRDPRGRRAGGRGLWRGPRLFDGGRHHLRGADHDIVRGQERGEDHPAPKRPPKRHGGHGAVRRRAGLCGPGLRRPAGHSSGHASGGCGDRHQEASQRQGGAGEQPHLLRRLLRFEGHRENGPRPRHALSGRRGPRNPLLFQRRAAPVRYGGGGGYGRRVHAQVRGQFDPEQPAALRPRHAGGACAADYQPDPDHLRLLPAAVQPGHFPAEPGPSGQGGLCPGGETGGLRPGGDQPHWGLLRLLQGADKRGQRF